MTVKRVMKLITNELLIGEVEGVDDQILMKQPFTVVNGKLTPYLSNIMGSSPAALQLNPMNIVWSVPLEDFPEVCDIHLELTTGIIAKSEPKIIF